MTGTYLSFARILMIFFCTLCEGMADLEPFYPERMASRILGMGDIATFLEKAQVNTNTAIIQQNLNYTSCIIIFFFFFWFFILKYFFCEF